MADRFSFEHLVFNLRYHVLVVAWVLDKGRWGTDQIESFPWKCKQVCLSTVNVNCAVSFWANAGWNLFECM